MKYNSKRWWRAQLRRWRRLRRADLSWVAKPPTTWDEKRVNRYNRAVKRLNRDLHKPVGGYLICDGAVECPVCGQELLTFGDPDEWTRNDNPARLRRPWDVSGYWPGMAECCGLLFAPDFEQQSIVVDEKAYRAAKARQARLRISLTKGRPDTKGGRSNPASMRHNNVQ